MNSSRPYIVRALIEWILDNDCTPYVVIQCDVEGVEVPADFIEDGKIVLNVSPSATRGFVVTQGTIEFESRFKGVSQLIRAPVGAIVAVYARENGAGMAFEVEAAESPPEPPGGGEGKPKLRVV